MEFTDTSGSTLREQTFNSTNGILSLTIALRITRTRSNALNVSLVHEFRELRRGNCKGPLSVTSVSGTANQLKAAIRFLITNFEVSDERESTSMKLPKWSTTTAEFSLSENRCLQQPWHKDEVELREVTVPVRVSRGV